MIGCSASATIVRNVPVPCRWNCAPTSSMYLRRVEEAVRRAVQRDEALAAGDVVEQRLLLLRRDLRRVGVDDQAVVLAERLGVEVLDLVGVRQLDAALLQHRLKLPEPLRRLMMAVVAEEQELERFGGRAGDSTRGNQADRENASEDS